ncbi:hypothetical protein P3T35_003498 [Kitasatospora sp. GP30]|uniref:hypothetical protein n=1 Tax=Kitasatospora sp. GP30 TaxID=3035084 RepID=UPI000C6FEA25|nr:hypothetical protein [Kitasatospora sp. GP30]MDH6141479.1 hypothetical protein [Kitasatospora sp. GP30]
MAFHFALTPPAEAAEPSVAEPLEDEEDYWYLAICASKALALAGYRFDIGGFGHPDWKFDVSYDMSTFAEQLPDLIAGLRTGRPVEIDLYSQGVERTLKFAWSQHQARITCVSRTSWQPSPATEFIDRTQLELMVREFCRTLASGLVAADPRIAALPPFSRWRDGELV